MTTKGKAVGAKKNTAVSTDVIDIDFMADAERGFEGAGKDSYAIPFLAVLQKISPQLEETDAKFIKEAKPGEFMNSVGLNRYDGKTGVLVLQCAYQRRFIKWGPRGTSDGGFKGEFTTEEAAQMRADGKVVEHEGRLLFPAPGGEINEKKCDRLVDTRNHFLILIDEETGEYYRIVLSLASSQIKKSKQLMTMLSNVKVETDNGKITPPTWFNKIRLVTVPESNDKGNWFGIKPTLEGNLQDMQKGAELYGAAKKFYQDLEAGTAGNVHYADPESSDEASEGQF